jgi:hypothetical protein
MPGGDRSPGTLRRRAASGVAPAAAARSCRPSRAPRPARWGKTPQEMKDKYSLNRWGRGWGVGV